MLPISDVWLLSLVSWYFYPPSTPLRSVLGASQCIYCNKEKIPLVEEMPSSLPATNMEYSGWKKCISFPSVDAVLSKTWLTIAFRLLQLSILQSQSQNKLLNSGIQRFGGLVVCFLGFVCVYVCVWFFCVCFLQLSESISASEMLLSPQTPEIIISDKAVAFAVNLASFSC